MNVNKKWRLVNTLFLTLYAGLSYPIVKVLLASSEVELIPAVLMVLFIVIHILIMIACAIFQWIGFFSASKIIITITTIAVMLGSFFAAFIPLIWFIPWGISNIISVYKSK